MCIFPCESIAKMGRKDPLSLSDETTSVMLHKVVNELKNVS
jgi:hypothetical protein